MLIVRLVRGLVAFALLAVALLMLFANPAFAADGTETAASTNSLLDTASWGLIAGVLTPLIVSVVQQPRWSGSTRVLVHIVAAIVVGILTCLANGTLDTGVQTVLSAIAVVLVASSASYRSLFKPAGVSGAIESATSPATQRTP